MPLPIVRCTARRCRFADLRVCTIEPRSFAKADGERPLSLTPLESWIPSSKEPEMLRMAQGHTSPKGAGVAVQPGSRSRGCQLGQLDWKAQNSPPRARYRPAEAQVPPSRPLGHRRSKSMLRTLIHGSAKGSVKTLRSCTVLQRRGAEGVSVGSELCSWTRCGPSKVQL